MVGTIGYVIIDDFTLMDAIYQTGITFTTVGFGEIAPVSDAGRIFTINTYYRRFCSLYKRYWYIVCGTKQGEYTCHFKGAKNAV